MAEDRQKSFWLRGELAEQLDRHIADKRRESGRRVTERSVLNDAVAKYLKAAKEPAAK